MILNRKFILEGASQQKFTVDLSYSESQEQKRSNIFFVMDLKVLKTGVLAIGYFVDNGFAFLKFNFSHNGMGLEDSVEFSTR
jgi:hypothetical protein